MVYFDPSIYSKDFIENLQSEIESRLLSGVQITEFISEGTQFQGVPFGTLEELNQAIQTYWDEVNNMSVIETSTNFY